MAKEIDESNEDTQGESKPTRPKGKSKKGLIIVLAVVLPLLIVGGAVGAAYAGLIKIPGLSLPGMKSKTVAANYTDKDDEAAKLAEKDKNEPESSIEPDEPTNEPKVLITKEPEPVTDPELGAKKLAGIWNNLEPTEIVRISAPYKTPELALVLSKMDAEKVAAVLTEITDTKRAATLSQEIQNIASIIPDPQT